MQPIIMHLDMNSYFASVEQQDNPQYRGKPLGVCEHLGGIIIAASVDAKRWGIKTGTPVWEARKLYPKIILTQTHPAAYRFYIRRVIKIVSDYTGLVEQYSIDELFADLTKACNIRCPLSLRAPTLQSERSNLVQERDCRVGRLKPRPPRNDMMVDPFVEAVRIAHQIKRRMKKEVADYLTCSIGIAENKLLAKIASDLKKPDGIVAVLPSAANVIPEFLTDNKDIISSQKYPESRNKDLPGFGSRLAPLLTSGLDRNDSGGDAVMLFKNDLYHRLKLTDIPGIGRRQEKNLNALGIKTLLDLKNYPLSWLMARFGRIQGYHLYNMGQLQGSWKPEVHQDTEIKSIGHMYTLPVEYRKPEFFAPVLYKLCEMVGRRLRRQRLMGDVIHFYVYGKDYQSFGKSRRLGFCLDDGREIFLQCMRIFEKLAAPLGEFKLISVTVAGVRPYIHQLSLFGDEERKKRLNEALDKINGKYGDFTVCRVPLLAAGKAFKDSIGFGRIKELAKF